MSLQQGASETSHNLSDHILERIEYIVVKTLSLTNESVRKHMIDILENFNGGDPIVIKACIALCMYMSYESCDLRIEAPRIVEIIQNSSYEDILEVFNQDGGFDRLIRFINNEENSLDLTMLDCIYVTMKRWHNGIMDPDFTSVPNLSMKGSGIADKVSWTFFGVISDDEVMELKSVIGMSRKELAYFAMFLTLEFYKLPRDVAYFKRVYSMRGLVRYGTYDEIVNRFNELGGVDAVNELRE